MSGIEDIASRPGREAIAFEATILDEVVGGYYRWAGGCGWGRLAGAGGGVARGGGTAGGGSAGGEAGCCCVSDGGVGGAEG